MSSPLRLRTPTLAPPCEMRCRPLKRRWLHWSRLTRASVKATCSACSLSLCTLTMSSPSSPMLYWSGPVLAPRRRAVALNTMGRSGGQCRHTSWAGAYVPGSISTVSSMRSSASSATQPVWGHSREPVPCRRGAWKPLSSVRPSRSLRHGAKKRAVVVPVRRKLMRYVRYSLRSALAVRGSDCAGTRLLTVGVVRRLMAPPSSASAQPRAGWHCTASRGPSFRISSSSRRYALQNSSKLTPRACRASSIAVKRADSMVALNTLWHISSLCKRSRTEAGKNVGRFKESPRGMLYGAYRREV
eukprot:PhM_4_TR18678/c1_g1_i2/m.71220